MLETSILDLSSKSKNSLKISSGLRVHQELAHSEAGSQPDFDWQYKLYEEIQVNTFTIFPKWMLRLVDYVLLQIFKV